MANTDGVTFAGDVQINSIELIAGTSKIDIREQVYYCLSVRCGWIREVSLDEDDIEKDTAAAHFLKTSSFQKISVCNLTY